MFTGRPIPVRDSDAANPVKPISGISIDGIDSDFGSDADVAVLNLFQEMRNSLSIRGVILLVRALVIACARDAIWFVRPGGVTCPVPSESTSLKRYRVDKEL
jgi:hypothetical protein